MTHQHLSTQHDLTVLAETFRLLGDATRLKILFFCLSDAKSVGDIAESLGISQALVSHHLRLLRAARLVSGERRAKHVFYEVTDHHVSSILTDMTDHIDEEHAED